MLKDIISVDKYNILKPKYNMLKHCIVMQIHYKLFATYMFGMMFLFFLFLNFYLFIYYYFLNLFFGMMFWTDKKFLEGCIFCL